MAGKSDTMTESIPRRLIWAAVFGVLSYGVHLIQGFGVPDLRLSASHTLLDFVSLALAILAGQQLASALTIGLVRRRRGPEGEIGMLTGFLQILAILAVVGGLVYSLGVLGRIGGVVAGFAGMLLGWSLQAPVSGVAAWILVTLKRPFRVGDRVFFSSLGLVGDVKHVGMMYTVMDQVGGSVGSEEAIGRDILIPNAMLFNQVAINYTPRAQASYILDEVVIRITFDSDWDAAEKILLEAAHTVTAHIIKETGEQPYIRSDMWEYGILMRLRYLTMAKDRPRIVHEIIRHVFQAVQRNPKVDMAIPFVYSFRKGSDGVMRGQLPSPDGQMVEIPVAAVDEAGLQFLRTPEIEAEADVLAKSIREHGLLQPIVVAPLGQGRYRVIAGHKRFLACRKLGWKTVPVVVQSAVTPETPVAGDDAAGLSVRP